MSSFPATGHIYIADFNVLRFELDFTSPGSLTYTLLQADGSRGNSETVAIVAEELRPGLFLVTWTEANGTTVVHIEDFERGTIITNITGPDHSFNQLSGDLSKVK